MKKKENWFTGVINWLKIHWRLVLVAAFLVFITGAAILDACDMLFTNQAHAEPVEEVLQEVVEAPVADEIDIPETVVVENEEPVVEETEPPVVKPTEKPATSNKKPSTNKTDKVEATKPVTPEPEVTEPTVKPTEPEVTEPPKTEEPTVAPTEPEVTEPPVETTPEPTEPVEESYPITAPQTELQMLACVIFQEAGGSAHCDECRRRVADVVLNRVADSRYPNTMRGVLTQKSQYGRMHWTGVVWPSRAKKAAEKKSVERAYRIAAEVLSGQHSALYGNGYIYQAEFKQGKDNIYCCGHYFGR